MRWFIRLKGDLFDLEDLEKEFSSCETIRILKREEHYHLWSKHLDENCKTAEQAYRFAVNELVPAINGFMKAHYPGFRGVEAEAVREEREDGSISYTVIAEATALVARARCSARAVVTKADGTVVYDSSEEPYPAKGGPWFEALLEDENVRAAFRLFNTGANDWSTLYKILEIIVKLDGAPVTDWVSKKQVERLTHTANNPSIIGLDKARHAKPLPPSPRFKPMTIEEATGLIGTILKRWVEWKASRCRRNPAL